MFGKLLAYLCVQVSQSLGMGKGHDYPNTLQTFPKQLPPETSTRNLRVEAMISIDYKDMLKDGKGTNFIILDVSFNSKIPEGYFSKNILKK